MHVLKSKKEQITLGYGSQILNGKKYNHKGIDIVKNKNGLDYIVAAQKGKVIKIISNVKGRDESKGLGNYVELLHGGNIKTRYCHLKYGSIKVKLGEIVKKGQVLGYMGDTGYTFGAHLHFEVLKNNKEVNPLPYLEDKKTIEPYADDKFTPGEYIVKVNVLTVRKGPGTNYDFVRYNKLSKNAKEQMAKLTKRKVNGYVKNMEFTASKIKEKENEVWAKTPSGWVCIKLKNELYCKKV